MKLGKLEISWRGQRGFEAAQPAAPVRRALPDAGAVPGFLTEGLRPIDGELAFALSRLRTLARAEVANSPFGVRAVSLAQQGAIGRAGLMPVLGEHPHADAVLAAYRVRSRHFDATGTLTRAQCERLVVASLYADGEAFAVFADDGRPELVDAARVPVELWQGQTRMGIAYRADGQPAGYYLTDLVDGRAYRHGTASVRSVSADAVAHIFKPLFAGQSRGYPWLTPALLLSPKHRRYMDSELDAAVLQAKNSGAIVSNPDGHSHATSDIRQAETGVAQPVAIEADGFDGSLLRLPNGADYKSLDSSHPRPSFSPFSMALLQAYASATGVPYSALASDVMNANFSSLRAERIQAEAGYRELQELVAERFARPCFSRWLYHALRAGELPVPLSAYRGILDALEFVGERLPHIQPREEARAAETRLETGITTLEEERLEAGRT